MEERGFFEKLIFRWGNSISQSILETPDNSFALDNQGKINYRIVAGCAIVFGEPSGEQGQLTDSFHKFCRENNWNVIYMTAPAHFANQIASKYYSVKIQVGEELIFNPQDNPTEGRKGTRLQYKVKQAVNHGLTAQEYLGADEQLENAIQRVGIHWLQSRRGPQLYLGNINFFQYRENKRWFYTKEGNDVTGMALLSKLENRSGWRMKFFITVSSAFRGTSELLMTCILETLRKEGCHYLTYCMVPPDAVNEITGLSKFCNAVSKPIFKIARKVFNTERRQLYWRKFHPKIEHSYVLIDKPNLGIKEIQALTKAFAYRLFV